MANNFLRLEVGKAYRTLKPIRLWKREGVRYPSGAILTTTFAAGEVPAGTEVVYVDQPWGAGSDPALEFRFRLPDGRIEVLASGWVVPSANFEPLGPEVSS